MHVPMWMVTMRAWVLSFVGVGVVCVFAVRHDRRRHGTDDTNDTGRVTMGLRAGRKWRAHACWTATSA
jgi:hypothetical protein